jgi:hypothetical protein
LDSGRLAIDVLSVWVALIDHGDFRRSGRRKTVQYFLNLGQVSLGGGNKNYIFAYIVIVDIAALAVLQGANILSSVMSWSILASVGIDHPPVSDREAPSTSDATILHNKAGVAQRGSAKYTAHKQRLIISGSSNHTRLLDLIEQTV